MLQLRHLYRTATDISSVVCCRFRPCRMQHTTRDGRTQYATIATQRTTLINEIIRGRRATRNTRRKRRICNDRYQPPYKNLTPPTVTIFLIELLPKYSLQKVASLHLNSNLKIKYSEFPFHGILWELKFRNSNPPTCSFL